MKSAVSSVLLVGAQISLVAAQPHVDKTHSAMNVAQADVDDTLLRRADISDAFPPSVFPQDGNCYQNKHCGPGCIGQEHQCCSETNGALCLPGDTCVISNENDLGWGCVAALSEDPTFTASSSLSVSSSNSQATLISSSVSNAATSTPISGTATASVSTNSNGSSATTSSSGPATVTSAPNGAAGRLEGMMGGGQLLALGLAMGVASWIL